MKFHNVLTAVVMAMTAGSSASFASTYAFDYTSAFDLNGPIQAVGTLTTGSGFQITGISGSVNGAMITGLTASPVDLPTNQLFYASPSLFLTDFSFGASDGLTYEIGNFYSTVVGLPYSIAYAGSTAPTLTVGTLSLSAVPLPASLPLYGTAILALGAFGLKRRMRRAA